MRILFVAHGYPPNGRGGTELQTRALAHGLAARGHDVSVFAGREPGSSVQDEEFIEHDGRVTVHWIDVVPDGRLWNPTVRDRFDRLLDDSRPDLVHVQHLLHLSAELIEVARDHGCATVVSLHDLWFQCRLVHPGPRARHPFRGSAWGLACAWHAVLGQPRRLAAHARRGRLVPAFAEALRGPAFLQRQLSLADRVVAPSKYVLQSFLEFGVDPASCHLLPHGSDIPPSNVPKRVEGPVRFGFVGPISRHKGVDVLCRAFRRLPGASTLSIYGPVLPGSDPARLMGPPTPRIRNKGVFEPHQAAAVYDSFDVLVAPSVVAESFSLTAIEAQARGLPVIASDIGALPERVMHGVNGLLVTPGDVSSLRAALHIFQDPHRVQRLSTGVRPPMPMATYIDGLESLYDDVLRRRSPAEMAYA